MDKKNLDAIDFSAVLAASVHDMKNSLSLLIQSIDTLGSHVPLDNTVAHEHISSTHYEALRLNTNLVQLLSIYRAGLSPLPLTIDECNVSNLLEDIIESNRYYCEQKKVAIEYFCEPDLTWFLDPELVYLMLNDSIVNALRYGKSKVILNANVETKNQHDMLVISVADDGEGYPQSMLDNSETALAALNVKEGRTGLGLQFARMIAQAHENKEITGEISLKNGGTLGGSVFTVNLP